MRRWFTGCVCTLTLFSFSPELHAAPAPKKATDVIVKASRSDIPLSEITSAVTIITDKQIKASGARDLIDVIRWVPGVQISQSGGRGRQASIFMRGTESDHTLVLLDGFRLNRDGGSIDMSTLSLDNVERIEVIRGPGSATWGSDAIGGVINIVTKKGGAFEVDGEQKHLHGETAISAGTFGSFRVANRLNGGAGPFRGSYSHTYYSRRDGNIENSDVSQTVHAGNFGVQLSETVDASLVFRQRSDMKQLFASTFSQPSFSNNETQANEYLVGFSVNHTIADWWKHTLRISKLRQRDRTLTRPTLMSNFSQRSKNEFRRETVEWQHTFYTADNNTLTGGFEWEREKSQVHKETLSAGTSSSDPTHQVINRAYYLQDHVELLDDLFVTGSIRFDDNDGFGTEHTWKLGAAYTLWWEMAALGIDRTTFRSNYGTAIKEPSMVDRFAFFPGFFGFPDFNGNPNLDPEESQGFEVGVDQPLFDGKAQFAYTFFYNDINNFITTNNAFTSMQNAGRARTYGHEVSVWTEPLENLVVRANVTRLTTEVTRANGPATASFVKDARLFRRADVTGSLNISYRPCDILGLFADFTYVGDRDDASFAFGDRPRVSNDAYARTDFSATVDVTKNVQLFGTANNLFNHHYEEVLGFKADGANFMGGVRFSADL